MGIFDWLFSSYADEKKGKRVQRLPPTRRGHPYYSQHFDRLKSIGHTRPTPKFGSPTLVWHIAVWPHRRADPQHANDEPTTPVDDIELNGYKFRPQLVNKVRGMEPRPGKIRLLRRAARRNNGKVQKLSELDEFHKMAIDLYDFRTNKIDTQINNFIAQLTKLGRPSGKQEYFNRIDPDTFEPQTGLRARQYDGTDFLDILKSESVGFTLWWGDSGPVNGAMPGEDAIRVRVHIEAHADFATLSFYVDVNARWNYGDLSGFVDDRIHTEPSTTEENSANRDETRGILRRSILKAVDAIKDVCEPRVHGAVINKDLLPEDLESEQQAKDLLDASVFLYDGLWRKFRNDFKLDSKYDADDLSSIVGAEKLFRIFANFKGLVVDSDGSNNIDAKDNNIEAEYDNPLEDTANAGLKPFTRFQNGDKTPITSLNEANAVIKAYWPFIRRVTPTIDYREVVACGVMNWRALYISSLGSQSELDIFDEVQDREREIPRNFLREDLVGYDPEKPDFIKYLFITKGKPNRSQIGRIVERINSMGVMRLYALKDWHILQNASTHVRMRGQELDEIIRDWTEGRRLIDNLSTSEDQRDQWIADYTQIIEPRLLSIGAALDRIGERAVGGIHYRINRSRYYVQEFRLLLKTLRVGNIDTWTSYEQFVTRGLDPAFDFISRLGERLDGLRSRLQAATESIQTSALVAQASATRQNTMELKIIARAARSVTLLGIISATSLTLFYVVRTLKEVVEPQYLGVAKPAAALVILAIGVLGFITHYNSER
jgi:Protein of unknown function (DUF3422)